METQLTVPSNILVALKFFAPDHGAYPQLDGIAVDVDENGAYLIASDGSMLACARVQPERIVAAKPLRVIIPMAMIENLKPKWSVDITIGEPTGSANGHSRELTLVIDDEPVQGRSLDAVFPDWRSLIPGQVSGEPAQYDLREISRAAKACETLGGGYWSPFHLRIGYNGENMAWIDFGRDDFFGAIAPLKKNASPLTMPAWVHAG